MLRFVLLLSFVCCFAFAFSVSAQAPDAAALAAALDNTKHKKKEKIKNGIDYSTEVYVDIKHEVLLNGEPADYSGVYRSGDDYLLELKVRPDGSADGKGFDTRGVEAKRAEFTLRGARMSGAVLQATKIFTDRRTEKLEAVFARRTTQTGKNPDSIDKRESAVGFGFIQTGDAWTSRVFLARN